MSYPLWPARLPRPERNTWSAVPQDGRLKRRSDAGPPGYKGRFSSRGRTVNLSVVLDRSQCAVFDLFFEETTAGGSRLFWMSDPTTHGWQLLTSDGQPLLIAGGASDGLPILLARQWLVTFGDNLPTETVVGVEFRKTFSVEVMP